MTLTNEQKKVELENFASEHFKALNYVDSIDELRIYHPTINDPTATATGKGEVVAHPTEGWMLKATLLDNWNDRAIEIVGQLEFLLSSSVIYDDQEEPKTKYFIEAQGRPEFLVAQGSWYLDHYRADIIEDQDSSFIEATITWRRPPSPGLTIKSIQSTITKWRWPRQN